MTYPNSSPIRRSARGTRGFQPGRDVPANDPDTIPPRADPYRPDTSPKRIPLPANDPRNRDKLIRYHLRRGGNLLRGFGAALPFGAGYAAASGLMEIYRQANIGNLPAPYPASGKYSHYWNCYGNYDLRPYRFKFWRNHTTWNDSNKCLTAQAQFRTTRSVTVEGTPGTGWEYWDYGDGVFIDGFASSGTRHWILWGNYCIGVGCATDRSNELAHAGWSGPAGEPIRLYAGSPWWFPYVAPLVSPQVNPHALPINVPVQRPKPMPYRSVPHLPVWDPYAPGTTPLRGPVVARAISPSPSPWQNGIVVRPGQPVQPAPPHVRRPPVKGEKERKPGRDVKRAIDPIVGPITEAVDAIDAVYDALSWSVRKGAYKRCRAGGGEPRECMTPQKKLKVIYDNADRLDMVKVVENLAKNHLEDRVIGELSRRADKNLRDRGWHDTFGRGPTSGPAL